MSFYQANLAVLAAGNAILLYRQYRRESKPVESDTKPLTEEIEDIDPDVEVEIPSDDSADTREVIWKFLWDFFLVYALAVAADWYVVCSCCCHWQCLLLEVVEWVGAE